jgi:hypothetical protein
LTVPQLVLGGLSGGDIPQAALHARGQAAQAAQQASVHQHDQDAAVPGPGPDLVILHHALGEEFPDEFFPVLRVFI